MTSALQLLAGIGSLQRLANGSVFIAEISVLLERNVTSTRGLIVEEEERKRRRARAET